MPEVTMPRLSDTMTEGTVGRWLKKVGDLVAVGEIIAEIETDKATMELESFDAGTVQQIVVPEGQLVPIGQVIAYIGNGAAPQIAPPAPAPLPTTPVVPAPVAAPALAAPTDASNGRLKASPLARKIAGDLGVDLRQVVGSGPNGRVVKEDVATFATRLPPRAPTPTPQAPAPEPQTPNPAGEPLSRMRKAITRAVSESKPGIPHIYVTMEIAMDAALSLREQINAGGARVSLNDLVVKAAARALRSVPALNVSYSLDPDSQPSLIRHQDVHLSVAVALPDGLVAPVVRDADSKSLGTISAEIRDLAGRAREGKIKPHELDGATFQVTNLGMYGISEFGSIITAPLAASLAVGAVRTVPVVRDNQLVIGQMMSVTLSA
ncbi:MAG: 2-oxo acid dehydrogenase subunit E2, partial [Oscillochloris sp.]|nr:2-oxo acid dehydrogenase subunit E2 [Oscillochloris sp.]